jgi:uncharacterized protein
MNHMKRVIIVHCWEGTPQYCWYPKVKKDLEEKGFEVEVPEMPETATPKLIGWLPTLQSVAQSPNEDLFLIGHSLGCITIMRYLAGLEDDQKVGGVVFVAGFTDDLGFGELKNFFQTPIEFEKVKAKTENFVAIASDNDPFVDLKYADELEQKFGAKKIIKHSMGHFSGAVDNETSCTDLPEVVDAILSMDQK